MRRQIKQLAVMLGLLVCSILLYLGAGLVSSAGGKTAAAGQEPENAGETILKDINASDIAELSWNNGEEELTAVLEGERWIFRGREDFPVRRSRIESMIGEMISLKAERTLEGGDPAEYGFDGTETVLKATTSDGTLHEVRIGQKASVGDYYYIRADEGSEIYMAATTLPAMASAGLYDFVQAESVPSLISVTGMTILKKGEESFSMEKPEDPEQYTYTNYYTWFETSGGELRPLDRGKAEKLASLVNQAAWESCVDYHMQDPAVYGLDEPQVTATVTDGSDSITLLVGNSAGEGLCYAAPEGSVMVYTIKEDTLKSFLEASYASLRPEDICRMHWETVTGMEFRYGDVDRKIEILPADGNSEQKYRYLEEGEEISYETMTRVKEMIDKMVPNRQIEDPGAVLSEDPVLTVRFFRNSENYREMDLEFFRYNDLYDVVRFNGEARQLISVKAAEAVIRLLEMPEAAGE